MPHEFSSTQVNLHGDAADALRRLAGRIPDAHLAEDGREDEPHVTVKYGLHTGNPDEVKRLLADEGPTIKLKLGKTSLFPANHEEGFEVVKSDVESPDLHRLNKKIARLKHTDSHPSYQPHATVAYVKIGKGKQYAGDTSLNGKEVEVDHVIFSSKDGKKTKIYLGSGRSSMGGRYRKEAS